MQVSSDIIDMRGLAEYRPQVYTQTGALVN